ncbi:MAG TPA: hypothetical protein DD401_06410 [Prevotella sp.]|nr:hypothetical protein [Prevotella sp.]
MKMNMKNLCLRFVLVCCLGIVSQVMSADKLSDYDSLKLQLNEHSLPLVNLVVDLARVTKPAYTQASMEVCDPLRRMDGNVLTPFRCKVKYRGNSSLRYEKKSFTVKLVDGRGEACDANLLGLRNDDTWVLDAMAIDRLRMRNRVNFDVWNDMSRTPYQTDYDQRNGTVGLFVELFVNGHYHGLYCLTDKVNRKLLGLKKAKVSAQGDTIVRGVLYKGNVWSSATMLNGYETVDMGQTEWNGWELAYPDELPGPTSYGPLMRFIDYCSKTTDQQLVSGVSQRFYMENLRDYVVFLLSQGIWDNLFKNAYLSVPNIQKGERMLITPWDLDYSLGGRWNGDYTDIMDYDRLLYSTSLVSRLWRGNLAAFKSLVSDRWKELRGNILSPVTLDARLDAYTDQLDKSGAWRREYDKWNGNPVPLKQKVSEEVNYVKDWYRRNMAYLDDVVYKGIVSGVEHGRMDRYDDKEQTAVYNLAGQRVSRDYKGLVIVQGKKLVRK